MDWRITNLDLGADSLFLGRGSIQSVYGLNKLMQMFSVRLIQGSTANVEEYDAVAGGAGRLVRQRLDADMLKPRIAMLIDAVKNEIISEQARQTIPDEEKLVDARAVSIETDEAEATEVSIQVRILNAAGAVGRLTI